jgi:uncharacterized protein (TIGR03437 family)
MSSISAQTAATLESAGYAAPGAPIPVAPGQVVTLFFRGIGPLADGSLRNAQAKTVPLPTVLGGLSARIVQLQVSLPIFSVRQENDCTGGQVNPACLLTSLRVQVPFYLQAEMELVLVVDGQASRSFLLSLVTDNAHVITSCDLTWDTNWTSICTRLAFHADGSTVTEKAPAHPGETIVVYLWGLGATSARVPTGEVSPPGAIVNQIPGAPAVRARFLDGPLVTLTARPAFFSQEDATDPGSAIDYAGLTPGQVGLYQLNIPIPKSLNPSTTCGDPILANAILHITTLYAGTEELGLCLKH